MEKKMERRYLINNRIRKIVRFFIDNRDKRIDVLFGLNHPQKQNRVLQVLRLFIVATCLSTCIYQIGTRVGYYISYPTVFNVYDEAVEEGDMPLITLCTTNPKEMQNLQKFIAYYGKDAVTISSLDYWNLMLNAITTIKSAYFTAKGAFLQNASVDSEITIFGTCANIFNGQPLPLKERTLKMHIEFTEPIDVLEQFIEDVGSEFIDTTSWLQESMKSLRKLSVTPEKYNFLNRKNHPCITVEEYDYCHKKCFVDYFTTKFGLHCRFPFTARNTTQQYCNRYTNIADVAYKLRLIALFSTKSLSICNCSRKCKKTLFYIYSDYVFDERLEIQIFLHSNTFRTVKERYAYGITSLLCDIGGNMGLYLGLSCLATLDIAIKTAAILIYNMKRRKLLTNRLFNKVYRVQSKILPKKQTRIKLNSESKQMHTSRFYLNLLRNIITTAAVCVMMLQTYERVQHYITYPTTNIIDLREDLRTNLMSVIVCSDTPQLYSKKLAVAKINNVSYNDIQLVDLIDHHFFSNVDHLWQNSSNHELFDLMRRYHGNNVSVEQIKLFGQCTLIKFNLVGFQLNIANYTYKVFFESQEYPFNLKSGFVFHFDHFNAVRYKKQLVERINTPAHPCVSLDEWIKCEQKCYINKLTAKNIVCNLPYIESLNVSSCKTTLTAKQTQEDYLDAYLNTDPIRDCSCKRRCEEKIYKMTITAHGPFDYNFVRCVQENAYWEVIKEVLVFPLVKLFCDLGSNTGSILGISLLSTYQVVEHVANVAAKIAVRKYFR